MFPFGVHVDFGSNSPVPLLDLPKSLNRRPAGSKISYHDSSEATHCLPFGFDEWGLTPFRFDERRLIPLGFDQGHSSD